MYLRAQSRWFLPVVAILLFGTGLGRALTGSEDRWAEIARNMLLYKDWFHPVINGEIYFDKPLLSYWLVTLAAGVTRSLDEFSVRLPCAVAGLLALFCSYRIATQLFDRMVAWLSTWLIATCFGFLFWTHTASAEMANLALITAALAWFIERRERTDFGSYLIFYLLCAIGSQMKGLTAAVVPILVIVPFLLRDGLWKRHLNLAHLAAAVLGIGVFLLPYLGASLLDMPEGVRAQGDHRGAIELLIRENLVRYADPFDHKDPFYSYLYHVPRIVFPWSLLLVAALVYYVPRYARLEPNYRRLLEAIGLIFLFFSASGSRRWYYILPIMPFCMMLLAAYLVQERGHRWQRPALLGTVAAMTVVEMGLLLLPVAARFGIRDVAVPMQFWLASAASVLGTVILVQSARVRPLVPTTLARLNDAPVAPWLPLLVLLAALQMTVVFGLVLPGIDAYRSEKSFALSLAKERRPEDQIVFFKSHHTTTVFYLNPTRPIPVIENKGEIPGDAKSVILVTEKRDMKALFQAFPQLQDAVPMIAVKEHKQSLLSDKSMLVAYRLAI